MANDVERRLAKLEQAIKPRGRVFGVWADDVHDIEAERERLRAERGMTEADELILFRWRRTGEGDGASEADVGSL
jgi:hypothetical protein